MRGLDQDALGMRAEKVVPHRPSPLLGSSRSEHRAKLTGLS